jgi:hypothetical protein
MANGSIHGYPKNNPKSGEVRAVTTTKKGTKNAFDVSEIGRDTNAVEVAQTSATGAAKLLEIPENATRVKIVHIASSETVWIGNDENITDTGTDVFPLLPNEYITLDLQAGNANNVYVVTDGTPVTVYAMGEIKE